MRLLEEKKASWRVKQAIALVILGLTILVSVSSSYSRSAVVSSGNAEDHLTLNAGNVCTKLLKDLVPIILIIEPAAKFTSDNLPVCKSRAALTGGIWALSLSH